VTPCKGEEQPSVLLHRGCYTASVLHKSVCLAAGAGRCRRCGSKNQLLLKPHDYTGVVGCVMYMRATQAHTTTTQQTHTHLILRDTASLLSAIGAGSRGRLPGWFTLSWRWQRHLRLWVFRLGQILPAVSRLCAIAQQRGQGRTWAGWARQQRRQKKVMHDTCTHSTHHASRV
jgi:hypothetical protein